MMEELKETEIGLVPDSWKIAELGKIVDFKTGKLNSNATEENGIYPFFTCSQETFSINKYAFNQEAILLSGNNARAIYSVKHYNGKFNAYQRTYVISILDEKEYDYDFLKHVLTRQLEHLRTISIGSQTKYLTLGMLTNLKIPIPSKIEQRKIAHVLSTVQKTIEQQDKLIHTTTELKKALMQKLFTEGTRGEPQKETEIGLVPESWEVVELGKYAYIENGFAFKSEDYVKDGIPLIRISNVSHGYLIEKDNKYLPNSFLNAYSKFSLQKGDLIISLTRPVTTGGLKYCFIEQEHLPALLNQRVGRFQLKDSNKLSKDFLYHLVFSNYFVGELFRLFGNSSQQPNVSPSQLESFKVPIPKIEEQNQIAKSLFILNKKSRIAELRKQTLTDLFKTLLHELMTGQRRVHELEFEKEYAYTNRT